DPVVGGPRQRHGARARGLTVHEDRARPALGQPAPEFGTIEGEVVTQDVEQRSVRIEVEPYRLAVDDERDHKPPIGGAGAAVPMGTLGFAASRCQPSRAVTSSFFTALAPPTASAMCTAIRFEGSSGTRPRNVTSPFRTITSIVVRLSVPCAAS